MSKPYNVRLEPVGVEMEVEDGETVLSAAFRQGIMLMHGCKEGQCSSCKAILLDGDIELLKYSTFALADYEREENYTLLCRTLAHSDLTVELLSYDEDLLTHSIPVRAYPARVTAIDRLTADIRALGLELEQPFKFFAGQYVDITLPGRGLARSFSMANPPGGNRLDFIIKVYPDGAFSSVLDRELKIGDVLEIKGPYGICFRHENRSGRMILVGGGSGMAPLWSIMNDLAQSGEQRELTFFYGARTRQDLFYLDRVEAISKVLPGLRFIPALSHEPAGTDWKGETGFIHEVVARHLRGEELDDEAEAYCCGPPPMIEATVPMLQISGVEPERIHIEKFTQASH
ncbi:MAG TPA: 2Fe-2S iron-sulfur cluster binding domain-containing protein [Candidatus Binataceae bacterium]|nr:2Fe-2S iron-sulfur cluster binding domain-containing protein [Candidatus Binataceae bacterium]